MRVATASDSPPCSGSINRRVAASCPINKAIDNTTMPNPPYHCIQARLNKKVCGLSATVASVDNPVVVTPETASNNASA